MDNPKRTKPEPAEERALARPRHSKAAGPLLSAAACLILLQGCVTAHLWGVNLERRPEAPGMDSSLQEDNPPFMEVLAMRLALTPLTVLIDIATAPIQAWWYDMYADEEDELSRRGTLQPHKGAQEGSRPD